MEEKVYNVEMMYIQNTSGRNYLVELTGRQISTVRLTFSDIDGVEFSTLSPLNVKSSYLQMGSGQERMVNFRFAFPTNFSLKPALGKILIEII